jgi:hypothetical protein
MPELTLEFRVLCNECGQSLDCTEETDSYGKPFISVDPCEKCLEEAKEESYSEGRDAGKEEEYNRQADGG